MKILVLGATGMLGNAVLRICAEDAAVETTGLARSTAMTRFMPPSVGALVHGGFDATSPESLVKAFATYRPDVVINCVGLVKQLAGATRVVEAVPINTMLPHRLAELCEIAGARLVHVSTDCVFTGRKGMYREDDAPDATDLYGTSKLWGEVVDAPHAITLRTSIIGHELNSSHGLLNWFLAQDGAVKGYRKAIFSGLPTVALARLIRDLVLPRPDLHGLYHVSAAPIDKFTLLQLFADAYGRSIDIAPDDALVIDRSLDSTRFRDATGYAPAAWPDLVAGMRDFG